MRITRKMNLINVHFWTYRKIPIISPGLIQLRKGFWVGLQTDGAYIGGGGWGGL